MSASFTKEQHKIAVETGKPLARLQYVRNVGDRQKTSGVDINGPVDDWVVDEIDAVVKKWIASKKAKG